MSYICDACSEVFGSNKGLGQHRRRCGLVEDAEALPDNALELYRAKKARKRRKLLDERQAIDLELNASDAPDISDMHSGLNLDV